MPEKTLVDAVMQRLGGSTATKNVAENVGFGPSAADRGIEVADLDAIANRHYDAGYEAGRMQGYGMGKSSGVLQGRMEARSITRASLLAITARLEAMGDALYVPSTKRDEETKKALRLRAIGLIDELIAGIGTLMAAHAQGRFEQGAEEKF